MNESINNSGHEDAPIYVSIQPSEDSSSNIQIQMKWSELETGCKEHPNDKQLPGVCSSCLRDKLSKLYDRNPIINNSDPLCSSSSPASPQPHPFSSAATEKLAPSNYVAPLHHRRYRRNASQVVHTVSSMLGSNYGSNLKKSRSAAFASRNRLRDRDVNGGWGRKKDGFWSKVLKLTRKDAKDAFMNARTQTQAQGRG